MRKLHKEAWSDFPALELVRTGRVVRLTGRVTLSLLVISIVMMVFVPWRQTAKGVGTVLALNPQERPQPVKSAAEGIVRLVKADLREGSYVEQGEILLELEPAAVGGVGQADLQIESVKAQAQAARDRIAFAEQQVELAKSSGEFMSQSLDSQYQAAENKVEQAGNEVALAKAELVDKKNKRDTNERIFPQGVVSRLELVSSIQEYEAQLQKVQKAEFAQQEALRDLEAKKQEINSKKNDIDIKIRDARNKLLVEQAKLQSINKDLSVLETKREELDRLTVKAPRSGYIQQWNGLVGSDNVKKGDTLFVIVPDASELAVEMRVNGNDMPLVHEGDRVRLQFEGWPAVQFVGWPSVAIGTFGGTVNRVFPTDDGKGYFRILVTPDNHFEREDGWPDRRFLRQGVRANGWVLLRRVPLGYEIWRQLNGFPPVLTEGEPVKQDKGSKVKLPKA